MKRMLLVGCALVVVWPFGEPVACAADQEAIDKAVERGAAFLHKGGAGSSSFQDGERPAGVNALTGLTLLECGAGPDDEVVRGIAETVRPASITLHETYSLALAILFLDRLGDPGDAPLIESMTVRLMGGQGVDGGWTYNCPEIGESEVRRLQAHLQHQSELKAEGKRHEETPEKKEPHAKAGKRTAKDLPKEIQQQLIQIAASPGYTAGGRSDNSNTQFATVALWVGRRQGLPVHRSLARLAARFRLTQNADGGWGYVPGPGPSQSTASMTCSGLLGLAVAHGGAAEAALEKGQAVVDPNKDRAVRAGLMVLGTAVGQPAQKLRLGGPPMGMQAIGGRSYYFFWSLERVAVALDLKTIGGKDWYGWGSEILLANQAPDGSWQGEYPANVDTCFALLFLKRANLTSDLTARLKGKLQDPGEVTLKAGRDGDDLVKEQPGFTTGLESKDDAARPGNPLKDLTINRPTSPVDSESALMARELYQAPAERRDPIVQKYRDGKGVTYTEALAGAIPQMAGEGKQQARDALAERLTRMKADTLVRYLKDPDGEIRRAAALAVAMKEDKALLPDLIPLLNDRETSVARAALAALRDLSGEKLGPSAVEWTEWQQKRGMK